MTEEERLKEFQHLGDLVEKHLEAKQQKAQQQKEKLETEQDLKVPQQSLSPSSSPPMVATNNKEEVATEAKTGKIEGKVLFSLSMLYFIN